MTLTEIRNRLYALSMNVERYTRDFLSEELLVLADYLEDLEGDIVGTISGLAQGLKELEGESLNSPFDNMYL